MPFGSWDMLFNLLLLLLWFRIWNRTDSRLALNPYLGPPARAADGIVAFMRPVFFGARAVPVAVISLLVLLVFRGLLVPRDRPGFLVFGLQERQPDSLSLASCLMFSALSFATFLFKLWGIWLIFARSARTHVSNAVESLDRLSRPFSGLALRACPAALMGLGILCAFCLDAAGRPVPSSGLSDWTSWRDQTVSVLLVKYTVVAVSGWVDLLLVLRSFLILLIIGSWIAMFTGAHGVLFFSRDWMELLMGPLRRYPLQIGMLDLTPLILIFALQFIHLFLRAILLNSYLALA